LRSLERANSSFICGFARFAALISVCGSLLQREQQPDVSIDLAVNHAIHAQAKE
jgi:hypothetical protein